MGALDHLPRAYVRMLPELEALGWEAEPLATCEDCAMARGCASAPRVLESTSGMPPRFLERTKCCTYVPVVPNFMAGRVLARGGQGAERIVARAVIPGVFSPLGLVPRDEETDHYASIRREHFGRTEEHVCPFFLRESFDCSIWKDRGSVCRTWYCKHEGGEGGHAFWRAARDLLEEVDLKLAEWCVEQGEAPFGGASIRDWLRWYVRCSARVSEISDAELERLRPGAVEEGLRTLLVRSRTRTLGALPEVPRFHPSKMRAVGDHVWLCGYSRFDVAWVPMNVLRHLTRLDGRSPWRTMVTEARADGAEGLDEALLRELFRVGVLIPSDEKLGRGPPG